MNELSLTVPDTMIDAIAAAVAARIDVPQRAESGDGWHLLDTDEVADRLGRSTRWVRERVKAGELPYVRLDGGALAFELEDVRALARSRRIDVTDGHAQ